MGLPKTIRPHSVLWNSWGNIKIDTNPHYPKPKTGKSGVAKAKRAAKRR